jgi:hypothetical protein
MGKLEDNLKKGMKSKQMKDFMKTGRFKDAEDKVKKIELGNMNKMLKGKKMMAGGKVKKMMAGGKVKKMMGGGMTMPMKKKMMGGGMTKIKYKGGGIVQQGVRPTKYV